MTRPTNYEKRGSSIRPEECLFYICVFLSHSHKHFSSWLQSLSSFLFLDLHIWILMFLLYLNKSSLSYTWRAEIAFVGLLSHPEHTSKFLPCNLSCATTVHDHFLINAAREVVVLYLMRRGWLLHPSSFIVPVFWV